jgi:hypothetical protein
MPRGRRDTAPSPMSATALPSTFARYRDALADLAESGERLDELEHTIDDSDLADDLKAALWLLAYFSGAPPTQSADGTH